MLCQLHLTRPALHSLACPHFPILTPSAYKIELPSFDKITFGPGVWMYIIEREDNDKLLIVYILKYVNLRGRSRSNGRTDPHQFNISININVHIGHNDNRDVRACIYIERKKRKGSILMIMDLLKICRNIARLSKLSVLTF